MGAPATGTAGTAGTAGTSDQAEFILANTALTAPPLVPEIKLHTANELLPIWEASEQALAAHGVAPPFWAFAWAGGQALARYILDRPELVAGRSVLDFAAGSGLVAIAAARAGASSVTAAEIDPHAAASIGLNAAANGEAVETIAADIVGEKGRWDVVLAGDVCYERPMADRVMAWLRDLAEAGALVLLGDPGRNYLPKSGLERITGYSVKTTREIEDTDVRNTSVWRVRP